MKFKVFQYRYDIITFLASSIIICVAIWTVLFCHNSINGSTVLKMDNPNGYYVENGHLQDNRIVFDDLSRMDVVLTSSNFYNHATIKFSYGDDMSTNPMVVIISSNGEEKPVSVDALHGQIELEIQGDRKFAISRIVFEKNVQDAVEVTSIALRGNIFSRKNIFWITALVLVISGTVVIIRRMVVSDSAYQKRDSNIELGRVLCMLFLVAHHLSIHGNIWSMDYMGENRLAALFLLPIGKIAFVFFVACSCWFLVDQSFKTKRFLTTWLQGLFYSVVFFAVACALGKFEIKPHNILSVFCPIIGNSHGFLSAYLGFYLLIPLLHMVSKRIVSKKIANYTVIILFAFESLSMLAGVYFDYMQNLRSEIGLFILCYFIALRLKRWPIQIQNDKTVLLTTVIVTWLLLWALWYEYAIHPEIEGVRLMIATLTDECSVTNIVAGFALFFFFKNIKIPKMPFVNFLAQGTLACLLIHDHNYFRYVIWDKFARVSSMYYASHIHFLMCVCGTVLLVFAFSTAIDRARVVLLERRIQQTNVFNNVCTKFDGIFNEQYSTNSDASVKAKKTNGGITWLVVFVVVCVIGVNLCFWTHLLHPTWITACDDFSMIHGDGYYSEGGTVTLLNEEAVFYIDLGELGDHEGVRLNISEVVFPDGETGKIMVGHFLHIDELDMVSVSKDLKKGSIEICSDFSKEKYVKVKVEAPFGTQLTIKSVDVLRDVFSPEPFVILIVVLLVAMIITIDWRIKTRL